MGCFGVSAPQLRSGTCCSSGANTVLFLQLSPCAGWARWLSWMHPSGLLERKGISLPCGALGSPHQSSQSGEETQTHPSFLALWLPRGTRTFSREAAAGPDASIPFPHPFTGWCRWRLLWPSGWPQGQRPAAHRDRRARRASCRPTWPALPRWPGWRRTGRCPGRRCAD